MQKVFGIGFHKTGTSSLGAALKILGYRTCGTKIKLVPQIQQGNLTPVFELAEQYDAYEDFPWPILYRELDRHFPGSRFILTVRDSEAWLKSCLNHFGARRRESLHWIYGEYHPRGHEDVFLERYERHNRDVLAYFENRPQDLLVMDISSGKGWTDLCDFLGCAPPQQPFPHQQKARYGLTKYLRPRGIKKGLGHLIFRLRGKTKPL